MPDIFYKVIKSITQPPRLVAISTVTTKVETVLVAANGTRILQKPITKTETVEKWSVKAIVDIEWVGIAEEVFFFPTEAACAVIEPGYKSAF